MELDLGVFASTGVNNAMGLAFDRSGNLYAANFGSNTMQSLLRTGPTWAYSRMSLARPDSLSTRQAICMSLISGNTIARFTSSGVPLINFTSLILNNPEGLAFDSLGNLYVANNSGNSITIFSPDRR